MGKTRCCSLPRRIYTGKFKKDWWRLFITVLLIPVLVFVLSLVLIEALDKYLGYFVLSFLMFAPLAFFYFLISWIIRACGCIGDVDEEADKGLEQPETEQVTNKASPCDNNNEQSEITALIGEIGKQSTITKEKIDIYAAAFLKEDINTRNAFYRCSEQDVESLIKKAGMTIGQKNAMIDIWLAKESIADPEAPSEGDAGLIEVANGQPGIVPASGELEE